MEGKRRKGREPLLFFLMKLQGLFLSPPLIYAIHRTHPPQQSPFFAATTIQSNLMRYTTMFLFLFIARTTALAQVPQWIMPPNEKYTQVGSFSEGLAWVQTQNENYGYCNEMGELVMGAQFVEAYNFSEGWARVEWIDPEVPMDLETMVPLIHYGFVDHYGHKIEIPLPWGIPDGDIHNGFFTLKKDEYIHDNIEPTTSLYYGQIENEKLVTDKIGPDGKEIENEADYENAWGHLRYTIAGDFVNGIAAVYSDNEYYYINTQHKKIFGRSFGRNFSFTPSGIGLAQEADTLSLINTEGKVLLPVVFISLTDATLEDLGKGFYRVCVYTITDENRGFLINLNTGNILENNPSDVYGKLVGDNLIWCYKNWFEEYYDNAKLINTRQEFVLEIAQSASCRALHPYMEVFRENEGAFLYNYQGRSLFSQPYSDMSVASESLIWISQDDQWGLAKMP
jgi:WG containing repeat